MLKDKNFTAVRKWVVDNLDQDQHSIFRKIYDESSEIMTPISVAQLVLIIAKYQYQAAFAASAEINLVACLVEIMMECEFQ